MVYSVPMVADSRSGSLLSKVHPQGPMWESSVLGSTAWSSSGGPRWVLLVSGWLLLHLEASGRVHLVSGPLPTLGDCLGMRGVALVISGYLPVWTPLALDWGPSQAHVFQGVLGY